MARGARRPPAARPVGASDACWPRALIGRSGYDPVYGARPLRRSIQRVVETQIGRALLSGEILDGAIITLDADGDELLVTWHNEPASTDGAGRGEPVGASSA